MSQHQFDKGYESSFNRYMVECEFIKRFDEIIDKIGFNRYMVECEFR